MTAELAGVAMADVLGFVWGTGVSAGTSEDGLLNGTVLGFVIFATSGVKVVVGILFGEDVEAMGATVCEGFADEVCVVVGSATTASAVGDAIGAADVEGRGTLPHSSPFVQGAIGTGGSYTPHVPPPKRWHVFHAPLKAVSYKSTFCEVLSAYYAAASLRSSLNSRTGLQPSLLVLWFSQFGMELTRGQSDFKSLSSS